jgi:3',5'-cyclic AMP phosphodiesterase CpdA
MSRIAHLADLHFGSVPAGLAEALCHELTAAELDGLVIAGDLTLTASREEFAAAKRWLDSIQVPSLIVPGNHDLPRWNVYERFTRPTLRYDVAVSASRPARLDLPDCVILGLNTTSPWQPHMRWEDGRVRRRDALALDSALRDVPPGTLKIVAAHHPFSAVPAMPRARPVRRALRTLEVLTGRGVALLLSGHTHQSFVRPLRNLNGELIAVGAPTALSSRRRGEENGYWLIETTDKDLVFTLRLRQGESFVSAQQHTYAPPRTAG